MVWESTIKQNQRKVIVLDDDPTGTQTVHDITVFTKWDENTIRACFDEKEPMVFILTNSRALTESQSLILHREIGQKIAKISKEKGKDFILVSRSDSTLRGHYPLETDTLRNEIEDKLDFQYDGEIICPFFLEGGRYTLDNIHYVKAGDLLVPAAQTEFAGDESFSYKNSDLRDWCVEKSKGALRRKDILSIPNEWLSQGEQEKIENLLKKTRAFQKVIVNAVSERDLKCFSAAFLHVMDTGRHFIIRSAASLPKVLGGISERPFLRPYELLKKDDFHGGIIVVGSHVNKTTEQVLALMESRIPMEQIEFNQHFILEHGLMEEEIKRAAHLAEEAVKKGVSVLIYTKREKLDPEGLSLEERAGLAAKISDALSAVISRLDITPKFIVAKGGITSSDICTKGLNTAKARVMGEVAPGVPVWKLGAGSRFPEMPYVIFPGNVGGRETLREVVERMTGPQVLPGIRLESNT